VAQVIEYLKYWVEATALPKKKKNPNKQKNNFYISWKLLLDKTYANIFSHFMSAFSFWRGGGWNWGFRFKTLCLLGRRCTTWATATPLFALVIFHTGPHMLRLGPATDGDPPTYTSHIAGITDMNYHPWLVGWNGTSQTFCPGWPGTATCLNSWNYSCESPHLGC
jgi:hypothetical protein